MYYVPIALAPRRREHESRDTRHDVFRRVRGSTSRLVSSNVSCLLSTPMVLASSLPQRRCVYMLEMRRVSPQHTRRDVTTQSASSRDDDSATSTQRLTARFAQHTKSLPNEPSHLFRAKSRYYAWQAGKTEKQVAVSFLFLSPTPTFFTSIPQTTTIINTRHHQQTSANMFTHLMKWCARFHKKIGRHERVCLNRGETGEGLWVK
jgi:hypothetical protein